MRQSRVALASADEFGRADEGLDSQEEDDDYGFGFAPVQQKEQVKDEPKPQQPTLTE